jgi:hypothetical protein
MPALCELSNWNYSKLKPIFLTENLLHGLPTHFDSVHQKYLFSIVLHCQRSLLFAIAVLLIILFRNSILAEYYRLAGDESGWWHHVNCMYVFLPIVFDWKLKYEVR